MPVDLGMHPRKGKASETAWRKAYGLTPPWRDATEETAAGLSKGAQNMQIIALASQKGGSGKTTLAGHLAVEAGRAGYGPVALIDADPQGSLASWWKQRSDPLPSLVRSDSESVDDDLQRLYEQGHRLVIIDTPPAATSAISEIVRVADLVVVPCRPSPHDLRAVGATVDIVERWGKPLVFAVNSATRRARITSEVAVALSQHGTVAPVTLHHRVDFAASMIDGQTVVEKSPNSASAKEVVALWEYVFERLNKVRGPVLAPEEFHPATVDQVIGQRTVHDIHAQQNVPAQMQAQVQEKMQAAPYEETGPSHSGLGDEYIGAPSISTTHTPGPDASESGYHATTEPEQPAAPERDHYEQGYESARAVQQRPGFGAPVHRPSFGRRRFAGERR
jgi:chromosome partitioning protein